MVNVWNQNLLVQTEDMAVHHRGIDFAFQRTYNSQSAHDYAGSDGAPLAGQFGSGWTNTFDAHIAPNSAGGVSVYDGDGTRYDYSLDASGNFTPPAGMEGTSMTVDEGGAEYYWTKKSGTQYAFYAPQYSGSVAAYSGRLFQISGRNRNAYLRFGYAWDGGDASTNAHLYQTVVTAENGAHAVLQFADSGGRRLCAWLQYPDQTSYIYYGYDASGNLNSRQLLSNGSTASNGSPARNEAYTGYGAGGTLIITNARWNRSGGSEGGGAEFFMSSGTERLSAVVVGGILNFQPQDGTGLPIQPGVSSGIIMSTTSFGLGYPGYTPFSDTDGHSFQQYYDTIGRPTTRYLYTGSQWLSSSESWDAHNNIIATVNERGKETDNVYDANGNLVATAGPSSTTSVGILRPTQLYSYDSYNNVIAACDEHWSHTHAGDWNITGPPAPSDTLCPTAIGTATAPTNLVIAYQHPAYEPYGQIASIVTAGGYSRTFSYSSAGQQGADYGLPTNEVGSAYTQPVDGTSNQEHLTLTYEAQGNVQTYNNGVGTTALSYDGLGRLLTSTDPDGVSTYRSYNPDSTVSLTETAFQHATATGVRYTYDANSNVQTVTQHFGSTNGVTTKWYDGLDRLVEVSQPRDSHDLYPFAWMTRYLYDLTGGGTITTGSAPAFRAYGNLAKTQEYLPGDVVIWREPNSTFGASTIPSQQWRDIASTAYDGLDRAVTQYRGAGMQRLSMTYDAPAARGEVATHCNANSECTSFTYDERGNIVRSVFGSTTTPDRTYTYDEASRQTLASSANGTLSDSYDVEGRKATRVQNVTGAASATLTYHYYPDGKRSAVDLSGAAPWTNMLSMAYRPDGKMKTLALAAASTATWTQAYTSGGRLSLLSDSTILGQRQFTYDAYGRTSATSGPTLQESGIQYDPEHEVTQQSKSYTCCKAPDTSGATYTSRGELLSPNYLGGKPDTYANGMRIPFSQSTLYPGSTIRTADNTFDPVLAVTSIRHLGRFCAPKGGGCSDEEQTFDYDAVGRLTGKNTGTILDGTTGDAYTKTYDVEDHLITQSNVGPGNGSQAGYSQVSYVWGPGGHPFRMGSSSVNTSDTTFPSDFQYDSLYWDDDKLLFTTAPSGVVDAVYIGSTAIYVAASGTVTTLDRDVTGQVVGCHNATGYGFMSQVNARWISTVFRTAPEAMCGVWATSGFVGITAGTGNPGRGGLFWTGRSDGFTDGYNAFQGVRSYDNSVEAWNTPDAYRGNVHDPASQKPYMWNKNNPYAYSDPSGFDTITMYARRTSFPGVVHWFIEVEFDDNGPSFRFSFGPSRDGIFAFGSTLVRKDQRYDQAWTEGANTVATIVLADCNGTCTRENGGFDEISLWKNAEKINDLHETYWPWKNSNSAAYTLCVKGGGGANCKKMDETEHMAPGLRNLLNREKEPHDLAAELGGESFDQIRQATRP
jgi:YD repeat-containing protein